MARSLRTLADSSGSPRRLAALALAAGLAALACGRSKGPAPGEATAPGVPVGAPSTATIGQPGGSLASPDGALTLAIPEGALSGPVTFSIQPITRTAPGGVVGAWRLGPEGTTFQVPVTLTVRAAGGGALAGLAIAYQDAAGYWLHARGLSRDAKAGTLAVQTPHFSDWTVVPSTADLSGAFTLARTDLGLPVAGQATLSYVRTDTGSSGYSDRLYLFSGALTLPDPLPLTLPAATTCSPTPPAADVRSMPTNVAEVTQQDAVSPVRLGWGASGYWPLTCQDASTPLLDVVFDSYGINYLQCVRTPGPQVIGWDRLAGSYTIDCSAVLGWSETASWDFTGAACDLPCDTGCFQGTVDCSTGTATCLAGPTASDAGTVCGADQVCDGAGACNACSDGAACTPAGGCSAAGSGTLTCGTTPSCAGGTPLDAGTACGSGAFPAVCDGAGACVRCTPSLACTPANVCDAGVTSCASGASTCADAGPDPQADGRACTNAQNAASTCLGGVCQ